MLAFFAAQRDNSFSDLSPKGEAIPDRGSAVEEAEGSDAEFREEFTGDRCKFSKLGVRLLCLGPQHESNSADNKWLWKILLLVP